jgi:hypothetical protein
MKGRISLKDFIHSVKNELLDTSASSEGVAAFEMTEIELETEFVLDTSAKGEGTLAFFVKLSGEATASQSHKVKVKLKPLRPASAVGFTSEISPTSKAELYPTTATIGSAPFFDLPSSLPPSGFPFVQLDPTKTIFGSSLLNETGLIVNPKKDTPGSAGDA